MQIITREIRGIPYFLLKEYLQELGGSLLDDGLIAGDGWRVRLEQIEPFRIGSLEVGQTRLTMEVEDEKAEDFLQRFALKTLRAGG